MRQFYILIFILIGLIGFAQDFPTLVQEEFQNIVDDKIAEYNAVGLSASARSGSQMWSGVAGVSEDGVDVTTNMTFGIGSVTKTITSAVIMSMWEEGLLDFEDGIHQYIQEFEHIDTDVTIHQLLNHTSGLYDYTSHPQFFADAFTFSTVIVSDTFVILNYLNPPIFPPEQQWSYSNTNYLLLGMIIRSITGNEIFEEARERFSFSEEYPSLNMPPFEDNFNNMAHLWGDLSGMNLPAVDLFEAGISMNALFSGAGAAGAYQSTAQDIANWAYDLYNGKLLEPATMTEMLQIVPPSEGYGYGVVHGLVPCSLVVRGHTGGIGYTSATFYNPINDLSVSVHCNDADVAEITVDVMIEMICYYDEYLQTVSTTDISEDQLAIFPNPFDDNFAISFEGDFLGDMHVSVYDEQGRCLEEILSISENISSARLGTKLPAGMYFVRIEANNQLINKKCIKIE